MHFYLKKIVDIEDAKIYYRKFNFISNPKEKLTHYILSEKFYSNDQLIACIEHYQILIQIDTNNIDAFYKLAYLIHIQAKFLKIGGSINKYNEKLILSNKYFHLAEKMQQTQKKNILTEFCIHYSQLLLEFSDKKSLLKVNELLTPIVQSLGEGSISFDRLSRYLLPESIQYVLDEQKILMINAVILAHYLLIVSYHRLHTLLLEKNQATKAKEAVSLASTVLELLMYAVEEHVLDKKHVIDYHLLADSYRLLGKTREADTLDIEIEKISPKPLNLSWLEKDYNRQHHISLPPLTLSKEQGVSEVYPAQQCFFTDINLLPLLFPYFSIKDNIRLRSVNKTWYATARGYLTMALAVHYQSLSIVTQQLLDTQLLLQCQQSSLLNSPSCFIKEAHFRFAQNDTAQYFFSSYSTDLSQW